MGTFNIKGYCKTKRIIVQIVTIDFETFYDTGFSLSRMTTEEYIQDDQFQVIGVAIKLTMIRPNGISVMTVQKPLQK